MTKNLPKSSTFGEQYGNLTLQAPYWEVLGGAMGLEDGRYEFGIKVQLPNLTFTPYSGIERLMGQLQGILATGINWKQRLRIVLETTRPPLEDLEGYQKLLATNNRFLAALHQSRVEQLNQLRMEGLLKWNMYLGVTYGSKTGQHMPRSPEDPFFEGMHKQRDLLIAQLNAAGLKARRMTNDDIFELCYRYWNPDSHGHPLPKYQRSENYLSAADMKKHPELAFSTFRGQVLQSAIRNTDPSYIQVGDSYVGGLIMGSSPNSTQFNMLTALMRLQVGYIVVDLYHLPYDKTLRALRDQARMSEAAAGSTEIQVDSDSMQGAQEAQDQLWHIRKSGKMFYRISVNAIVVAKRLEDLRHTMADLQASAAKLDGNPLKRAQWGVFEPYKQLAPFNGVEQLPSMINGDNANAADLFPLPSIYIAPHSPALMLRTAWGNLTPFNPFSRNLMNYNGVIVGSSGSGKSNTVLKIATEMAKQDDVQCFFIEPKPQQSASYHHPVQMAGGTIFEFHPDGKYVLNPFDLPEGEVEPSGAKMGYLKALIRCMVGPAVAEKEALEDAIIEQTIQNIYRAAKTHNRIPTLTLLSTAMRNLDSIGKTPILGKEKEIADQLVAKLNPWTAGAGRLGHIFDGETNINLDSELVFFNISGLGASKGLAEVGTLVLFDIIANQASRSRKRTMVFLDEVWKLLKIPAAANQTEEFYRLGRSRNMSIWAISQSIADFLSDAGKSILNNVTIRLVLPCNEQKDQVLKALELPDESRDLLNLSRIPGEYTEGLLFTDIDGVREGEQVHIMLSPLEAFAFSTHPADMRKRETIIEQKGLAAVWENL